MVSDFKSRLTLSLLCLSLGLPLQAETTGANVIYIDLPKGIDLAAKDNVVSIAVCTDDIMATKPQDIRLDIAGRSTRKNGKQRVSLNVARADLKKYKALVHQAEARAEPDCVFYTPYVTLCREGEEGLRFTTVDWGVRREAKGAKQTGPDASPLQVDSSLPVCAK